MYLLLSHAHDTLRRSKSAIHDHEIVTIATDKRKITSRIKQSHLPKLTIEGGMLEQKVRVWSVA